MQKCPLKILVKTFVRLSSWNLSLGVDVSQGGGVGILRTKVQTKIKKKQAKHMLCFSALKHNFSDQWGGHLFPMQKCPLKILVKTFVRLSSWNLSLGVDVSQGGGG